MRSSDLNDVYKSLMEYQFTVAGALVFYMTELCFGPHETGDFFIPHAHPTGIFRRLVYNDGSGELVESDVDVRCRLFSYIHRRIIPLTSWVAPGPSRRLNA
jgi:hypothetical protein